MIKFKLISYMIKPLVIQTKTHEYYKHICVTYY